MNPTNQNTTRAPDAAPSPLRAWLAVIAVSLGTFTVVTSEMLPVGLLTPMASSLDVSEGVVGQTLTITGIVAAISAPAVPLAVRGADRRTVLIALMGLLFVANALTAWAPTFAVVIIARVLLGIAMGGVWAISAGLGPRLVPSRSVGTATAMIFSGIAVASVLGVPLGTFLGDQAGWESAFLGVGALGLLVAVGLVVFVPRLPAEGHGGLSGMSTLARNPMVATGLIVAVLLVSGHFAAYTYVRPALELYAGAGAGLVSTLLLVYGIAGTIGNFVAGPRAIRAPRATIVVITMVLGVSVVLVPFVATGGVGAGALLVLWGLAYGGVSVALQSWMMRSAPEQRETVSSLGVGVFTLSIALGALVGGIVVDGFGVTTTLGTAGVLAAGAFLVAVFGRAPSKQVAEERTPAAV